jgi:hypothetical protein
VGGTQDDGPLKERLSGIEPAIVKFKDAEIKIPEGSRNLLAESVVAKWGYCWQKGEPYGHDSLYRQDFSQVGPPDP